MQPSPALGLIAKAKETIEGRVIGCLVTDGVEGTLIDGLRKAIAAEGAKLVIIAPKIGGVVRGDKKPLLADGQLAGSPSVLFDAVILAPGAGGGAQLAKESAAIGFVRDAFGHLKVIGFGDDAAPLLAAAGVSGKEDEGLVGLAGRGGPAAFVAAAKKHRVWAREPKVRTIL